MNEKHEKALQRIKREIVSVPEEVLEAFLRGNERHSYSARLDGHHAIRNVFIRPNTVTSCSQTDILVISGRDYVDGTGRATLPILFCGTETDNFPFVMFREPNFVATPHGSKPSFITTTIRSTPRQLNPGEFLFHRASNSQFENYLGEVYVDVMAWRGDESPAGDIQFSWICTIEVIRLGNVGG